MTRRKLHVWVVHEEYKRKPKNKTGYKIVGVYYDHNKAIAHKNALVSEWNWAENNKLVATKYVNKNTSYISITKHTVRGADALALFAWRFL